MKMKANMKQVTRYTDEEKRQLFQEGKIRSMAKIQESKKKYSRKDKSWKKFLD